VFLEGNSYQQSADVYVTAYIEYQIINMYSLYNDIKVISSNTNNFF